MSGRAILTLRPPPTEAEYWWAKTIENHLVDREQTFHRHPSWPLFVVCACLTLGCGVAHVFGFAPGAVLAPAAAVGALLLATAHGHRRTRTPRRTPFTFKPGWAMEETQYQVAAITTHTDPTSRRWLVTELIDGTRLAWPPTPSAEESNALGFATWVLRRFPNGQISDLRGHGHHVPIRTGAPWNPTGIQVDIPIRLDHQHALNTAARREVR